MTDDDPTTIDEAISEAHDMADDIAHADDTITIEDAVEAAEPMVEEPTAEPDGSTDWGLTEHPTVSPIIASVASRVGSRYGEVTSKDDQCQEAMLLVASNPARVHDYLADPLLGERALWTWLHQSLVKGVRTIAARAARTEPLPDQVDQ